MDVTSDATHQWNSAWLSGQWTMADDPPRVLNVFKCINKTQSDYFDKYLILVTLRPWTNHSNMNDIIEEFEYLDVLTAQCIVYEMLEKYSDAPVRDGVRAVDER